MSLSDDQIKTLRENCVNKLVEKSDDEIRSIQDESMLPPQLFVTYYLREEGMKLKDIAEEIGVKDKSGVGKYLNRIKGVKEEHEMTSKVFELSEKTDEQKRKERKHFAERRFAEIVDEKGLEDLKNVEDVKEIYDEIQENIEEEFSVKIGVRTIQDYTKEVRKQYE